MIKQARTWSHRQLPRLVGFGVVGLVVSVLVAWLGATTLNILFESEHPVRLVHADDVVDTTRGLLHTEYRVREFASNPHPELVNADAAQALQVARTLPQEPWTMQAAYRSQLPSTTAWFITECGYPLRCLWMAEWSRRGRWDRHGVFSWSPLPRIGSLPRAPIAMGLMVNTVFYGLITYISVRAIAGARRIARALRGRCTRCGYSLVGLSRGSPCPECGERPAALP